MVSNSVLIAQRSIAAARRRVRQAVEGNMVSTVRITRPPAGSLDDAGELTVAEGPVVYEGKAHLSSVAGPVTYTIGDEVQFFSNGSVTIPLEDLNGPTWIQVNDLVEVTGHDDPVMAGKRFRIIDVEATGLLVAGRKAQIIGIQRYPGWIDSAVRHPSSGRIPDEVPPEWRV